MTWETYYEEFYGWAESTQLSYLSRLTDFGPSAEVCELAQAFFEEASANRLIRKALAAGVRFTAEEVLELDGVVAKELMPRLIKTTSTPLSAELLDEFSFLLTGDELRALARQHGITVDESGYVELPLTEEEKREAEAWAQEQEQKRREELTLARFILAVRSLNRRERREKRRKEREKG